MRHPGEICRGEVCVRGKVDESEIDDKLDDLQACHPLLPPDANTSSALEVIPVHDDVDCKIQSDWNP